MFSIVIPLFNKEKYIGRALHSVISQTLKDWECIIVDDGSTDRSIEVVSQFSDPRIRLIRQVNRGPSAARNRGALEAKAEWIALLDADDYWLEFHLENLAYLTRVYPQCGVVAANFYCEYPDGKRVVANRLAKDKESSIQRYFEFVATGKGALIHSSSCAVRKDLWVKVGGFREGYRLAEDADFWARLCLLTDFAIHHTPSSVYFQDTSGFSTRTYLYVGDAPFADLAKQIPPERKWAYERFLAGWRMQSLALGTLLTGDKRLVRKMAKESFSYLMRRSLLFLILSFLPTSVIQELYHIYRAIKGFPVPPLVPVKIA